MKKEKETEGKSENKKENQNKSKSKKTADKKNYDVIIVGGGAAGLTAAIYTRRKLLKTLVVTMDVGGQNLLTEEIENYPGYKERSGPKLMQIFYDQALSFGSEVAFGRAVKLEKTKENLFKITLGDNEQHTCKTLILAYGKVPKKLGVPGEDKFIGRGISTCAECDAPLMRNKTVAVLGGGNSALEAAELLSKFAAKVYLIHRRDAFRADEITVKKIKAAKNIEMVLSSNIVKILGKERFKGIVVENVQTSERRELEANGLFLEIGYVLDTEWVKDFVERDEVGEIVTNKKMETGTEGIFAAGDVTNGPYKQTVTAAAEGAIAGLSAYNWLMKKEGKPEIKSEWG
jgi:thioredoxin-disulfide reductase